MNLLHRLIGGLVGLATAGAAARPSRRRRVHARPSGAGPAAACTDVHWPTAVQGRPVQFRAGAKVGDYIWHDATGWHVRVTHPGRSRLVFTGQLVSSAPMAFKPVALENGDVVTLSADRKTFTYRLVN